MIEPIDYRKDGVKVIFYGLITSREIFDANTEIINHSDFASFKYQLWVFHSVEDVKLSADEIWKIAEQDKKASKINPEVKVAIVADSPLVFGLARMYEAFSEENSWEIMVFHNLYEAQEWINS